MEYILVHEGQRIGRVSANHSMSRDDVAALLKIDLDAECNGDPIYNLDDLYIIDSDDEA